MLNARLAEGGTPGLPHRARVAASNKQRHARPKRGALSTPPRWGQNGVLDLYATKLVSICVHSYAKCIYLDVAFCRYWGNSAACGVGRVADVDELEATEGACRCVKQ